MNVTKNELPVLLDLDSVTRNEHGDVWCANFAALGGIGTARAGVRRACRSLARKGLAEYHKGLWTEDGEPAGAGYCISKVGIAYLEERGMRQR